MGRFRCGMVKTVFRAAAARQQAVNILAVQAHRALMLGSLHSNRGTFR